ncbi:MAG: MATE family efflux transporter [Deltaproteobacteria bacterium]|nr:MATE family efflux transporter [Deltaproteobacteria bacterium]MBW2445762.1 MATE family efflux transporter [Deltaproteobacteria bacterium]
MPVLVSLVAEPLTGLVDTFFVKDLGAVPLAALGLSVILFSSVLWAFNFLGIGTQTEVATADGAGDHEQAREAFGAALMLAVGLGVVLGVLCWPFVEAGARFMGADGAMVGDAAVYLRIRLLGAPATLMMMASFGALRGLQDMKTPLRVAVGSNLLNVALDTVLIFGAGPIPAFGIAGAAWASTVALWVAALWGGGAAYRRLGWPQQVRVRDALGLFVVGRDLFVRTGLLIGFLMLGTRVATQAGAETGAAHHAIRQVWTFLAFLLDAYANAAQSLIGYFLGAGAREQARRVAKITCGWGIVTGLLVMAAMLAGEGFVARSFVPTSAHATFAAAWWVAALAQPLNAVAFVTDGILWGAGDYRYMRNGMIAASGICGVLLLRLDVTRPDVLVTLNLVIVAWIAIRSIVGLLRVWPGVGASRLR